MKNSCRLLIIALIFLLDMGNVAVAIQKSDRFRVRLASIAELTAGIAGVTQIKLELSQFDGVQWTPSKTLTLFTYGLSLGAKIGISGSGEWVVFTTDRYMSIEEFDGMTGGVTFKPGASIPMVGSAGGGIVLIFQVAPGKNKYVPIPTGGGLGFTVTAQYTGTWSLPPVKKYTHEYIVSRGWKPIGIKNRFCRYELACIDNPKCPNCPKELMRCDFAKKWAAFNKKIKGNKIVIQNRYEHNTCIAQSCEGGTQNIPVRGVDGKIRYKPANYQTYECVIK